MVRQIVRAGGVGFHPFRKTASLAAAKQAYPSFTKAVQQSVADCLYQEREATSYQSHGFCSFCYRWLSFSVAMVHTHTHRDRERGARPVHEGSLERESSRKVK